MTSLYEELEESEVSQFGRFLPVQKLPYFCLQNYVDFLV
jgi:hypothetical protein